MATEAIDVSKISQTTQLTVDLVSDAVREPTSVTVTLNVSSQDNGSNEQSYVKVLPVTLSGNGAGSVTTDVQMVEISYHMENGYEDGGAALTAYINVPDTLTSVTTAQIQLSYVEGLVVDSITPSVVTLYPNNYE